MAFCHRCGKKLPTDAQFCPSCGSDLRPSKVSVEPGPLFTNPVVKILAVHLSCSVGDKIDLDRAAKVVPGGRFGKIIPDGSNRKSLRTLNYGLGYIQPAAAPGARRAIRVAGPTVTLIETGRVLYLQAPSEEQGRRALADLVGRLKQGIRLRGDPTVNVDQVIATAFLGRGIKIASLPDRVADSYYVSKEAIPVPGGYRTSVLGKYNKGGSIFTLDSDAAALGAMADFSGVKTTGLDLSRSQLTSLLMPTPHTATCRLPATGVIVNMPRGNDRAGHLLMTGLINLAGAHAESQVRQLVTDFAGMLDRGTLLGPLTPLNEIPETAWQADPRAFDYFAQDPKVWPEGTG